MDPLAEYVRPCGLIDADHPSITSKAKQLTAGLSSETDKAVAIYKFVKDGILFGFSPEFGGCSWTEKHCFLLLLQLGKRASHHLLWCCVWCLSPLARGDGHDPTPHVCTVHTSFFALPCSRTRHQFQSCCHMLTVHAHSEPSVYCGSMRMSPWVPGVQA